MVIILTSGDIPSSIVARQNEAASKDYRVYVDLLRHHGWKLMGTEVKSCRLFTDGPLSELHKIARQLGIEGNEFVSKGLIPRYDLSEGSRRGAIMLGAKNLQTQEEEQIAYAKARSKGQHNE